MGLKERLANLVPGRKTEVSSPFNQVLARSLYESGEAQRIPLDEFEKRVGIGPHDIDIPEGFFSRYYQPEDPKEIQTNRENMDHFLEEISSSTHQGSPPVGLASSPA